MEAKFKVGDKVRVKSNTSFHNYRIGYEGEIKKIEKFGGDTVYDLGYWYVPGKDLELIDQPHKEEGKATETPSFMVFVEERSFPKVKHTLDEAHKEAKRLCLKEKRRAHIISTFGCYELSAEFKSEI